MKAWKTGAALGLALMLAACGGSEADKGGAAASGPITPIAAPAGKSWTDMVSETPQGGFVMGNPDAPVKVVEFASLTCGVCGRFATEGFTPLIDNYVKTGRVSFEMRNFVRDPADLAGALLSRCNGAAPYFQLTEQMFATQSEWLGKLQSMPPEVQQQLQTAEPAQAVATYANAAELPQFVQARGIPAAKAQSCLADQAAVQKLVDATAEATRTYQVTGTPTFLINNQVAQGAVDWASLEPRIRAALGS